MADAVAQLTELGTVILTTKYALAVAITVLAYDYLITLDQEVSSVWRQRSSWVSGLFFVNRYYWIIAAIIQGFLYWSPTIDEASCRRLAPFEAIGAVVPFLTVSQLLMGIRVYALLGRHWIVLVILALYASAQFAVGLYLTLKGSTAPIPPLHTDAFTICLQSSGSTGSQIIAVMLLTSLGMDTFACITTACKTLHAFRASESGLAHTIFADNLRYFAVVLASNATAAILTLHAKPEVFAVAGALAASLNTVMASPVTMNLRTTAMEHTTTGFGGSRRRGPSHYVNGMDTAGSIVWTPNYRMDVSLDELSQHSYDNGLPRAF